MFGFSFGEVMVLVIVGIIVVGPRRLPAMMRTAGGWIAKLRRMTTDLRTQSGIDDLIRQEGLEREIRELRALSRVNVIETLVKPVIDAGTIGTVVSATPRVRPPEPEPPPPPEVPPPPQNVPPLREREYPVLGCDAYGAEIDDATKPADAAEGGAAAAAASGAAGAAAASGAAGAEDAAGAAITAAPAAAAPQGATITAGSAAAQETAAAPEAAATGNGAAS
ncbi:Sec-independent protein translocase protein TatB [Sorangium sp. So ce861]|uniref:Sec-independent protein translocase protein TatB n=1 Tax=Sorangium sp. So ce861 TaxID=3133323 RepID=UPI003F5F5511